VEEIIATIFSQLINLAFLWLWLKSNITVAARSSVLSTNRPGNGHSRPYLCQISIRTGDWCAGRVADCRTKCWSWRRHVTSSNRTCWRQSWHWVGSTRRWRSFTPTSTSRRTPYWSTRAVWARCATTYTSSRVSASRSQCRAASTTVYRRRNASPTTRKSNSRSITAGC